jgi:hypothetical protein
MTDSILQALEDANPASEADFTALPPFTPPRRSALPVATGLALAIALAVLIVLSPSSTPGGGEVLARAFARPAAGTEILYWRTRTEARGVSEPFTDDVWMRVRADGTIDTLHELRLDGSYAGMESVVFQPHGFGDPRGAVTRTRSRRGGRIRTGVGIGYPEVGLGGVIAKANAAARGRLDVGAAREVGYRGRDAYEIRIGGAAVTLWVDRETGAPLGVRWGEGGSLWRTMRVLAFKRLGDDRRLLDLG